MSQSTGKPPLPPTLTRIRNPAIFLANDQTGSNAGSDELEQDNGGTGSVNTSVTAVSSQAPAPGTPTRQTNGRSGNSSMSVSSYGVSAPSTPKRPTVAQFPGSNGSSGQRTVGLNVPVKPNSNNGSYRNTLGRRSPVSIPEGDISVSPSRRASTSSLSTIGSATSATELESIPLSEYTQNAVNTFTDEAIAELIAYEQDEDGFATLKFLVEVDTDEAMEGGGRETYQDYITRLQNKDYVEKTYELGMNALGYYGYKRSKFETTKTGAQCEGVGITSERPCWLCGNQTNVFKDVRGPTSYIENGAEFRICEPDNNEFQCEHILPAGLMGFLDYLYMSESSPVDQTITRKLYDSSCRTCNRIKLNTLYIRSNGTLFEPNVYEIQKDIIGFFLDICGSKKATCPDTTQRPAKKIEEGGGAPFYYHSVVSVSKDGIKTQYPNLIIAKLHAEGPPAPRVGVKRARVPEDPDYAVLSDIFTSLENKFSIARIYESSDGFDTIPNTIEKRIPLVRSVQWIQGRFTAIFNRLADICRTLNEKANKAEWDRKYINALTNPPYFVQRIGEGVKPPSTKAAARALARNRERALAENMARAEAEAEDRIRRERNKRALARVPRALAPAAPPFVPPPPPVPAAAPPPVNNQAAQAAAFQALRARYNTGMKQRPLPPSRKSRKTRKAKKARRKNTRRK